MEDSRQKLRLTAIVLLCVLNIGFGFSTGQLPMMLSGAAGIVYAGTAAKKMCSSQASPDAAVESAEAVRS